MRNGRDRRSDNPSGPTRYLSACYCLGPISGSHQGQRPQRPHRDEGTPPRENRPHTWLHPDASQKSQIPLAPRAPSIHGPSRHVALRSLTVAFGAKRTNSLTLAPVPFSFPSEHIGQAPALLELTIPQSFRRFAALRTTNGYAERSTRLRAAKRTSCWFRWCETIIGPERPHSGFCVIRGG